MRTCSSVLAVARAQTFRLPRGSLARRLTSAMEPLERAASGRRCNGVLASVASKLGGGEAGSCRFPPAHGLPVDPRQPGRKWLEVEVRKGLVAVGDVEKPVQEVRARPRPRHRLDLGARVELG